MSNLRIGENLGLKTIYPMTDEPGKGDKGPSVLVNGYLTEVIPHIQQNQQIQTGEEQQPKFLSFSNLTGPVQVTYSGGENVKSAQPKETGEKTQPVNNNLKTYTAKIHSRLTNSSRIPTIPTINTQDGEVTY